MFIFTELPDMLIFDNDWKIIEVLCEFLKKLKEVYYPTTITEITELFHTYRHDSLFDNIIKLMEEKFNKCFKQFCTIFYFATIMDPRIKFEGCKYLIENFYEKCTMLIVS